MALGDFAVFNQFAYSSATEIIDQQVQLFNAASRGAIVLGNQSNIGDFYEEAMYRLISGLVGNRNAYSTADLASIDLEQLQHASVKVGIGSQPVRYTGTQFDWIQRPPEEAGTVFGTQVAEGMLQYMLNTGIASLVAALSTQSDLNYDGTAGTVTRSSLNRGAGRLGDRRNDLAAWIMHSQSVEDLFNENITNANRLFDFGGIAVMEDGFGKPIIMTDAPALVFDNSGTDNYRQLGLTPGAVVIQDNGDFRTYEMTNANKVNAEQIVKAESSVNIGIKGFTWDKTNGGRSPNDAALATGANWDYVLTSRKDGPGVLVTTL